MKRGSKGMGLDPELWKTTRYDYALVPVSQSIRLAIAKEICCSEESSSSTFPLAVALSTLAWLYMLL